jgi:hypothetical protein
MNLVPGALTFDQKWEAADERKEDVLRQTELRKESRSTALRHVGEQQQR